MDIKETYNEKTWYFKTPASMDLGKDFIQLKPAYLYASIDGVTFHIPYNRLERVYFDDTMSQLTIYSSLNVRFTIPVMFKTDLKDIFLDLLNSLKERVTGFFSGQPTFNPELVKLYQKSKQADSMIFVNEWVELGLYKAQQ